MRRRRSSLGKIPELLSSRGLSHMDDKENLRLASQLVNENYLIKGQQGGVQPRTKHVKRLLSNKQLPEKGWDPVTIERFLQDLALMDSNNFVGRAGVGEREGRIYSNLVAKRHFGMTHGIGRSGDVAAVQPKAAGSSLLVKLTNVLVTHAIKMAGIANIEKALVLPLATGMTLALTFLSIAAKRPGSKWIIWARVDQKSCFKCMITAGFHPVILGSLRIGDAVTLDLHSLDEILQESENSNILCVVTTTSCFAPRIPDPVDEVAKLCKKYDVPHVVNNAYGLQCARTCRMIRRAITVGRVDAIVQSTDKNFMVPVGGAVVYGPDDALIDEISKTYAGRANAAPIQDLFITLLEMGQDGYRKALDDREKLSQDFAARLKTCIEELGGRLLDTFPQNSISFAVSLDFLEGNDSPATPSDLTAIGSMLYTRGVSGCRVVPKGAEKAIGPFQFQGYGAHINDYPCSYLTASCAIGMQEQEVHKFLKVLRNVLEQCKSKFGSNT